MKFDKTTLITSPLDTLVRHILLIAQVFRLRKQLDEDYSKLNQQNPALMFLKDNYFGDLDELNETRVLTKEEIDAVWSELDTGTDVLDILKELIAQYQGQGITPNVETKSDQRGTAIKAVVEGVTGDDLAEIRASIVIRAFDFQGHGFPDNELDIDCVIMMLEGLDGPGMGLSEDQISQLVHLEGEPLWELIAEMVADGNIAYYEGVYLPLPQDELAA